tara:strand:+ start:111 stop:359 length:249 start_codon:yes stop_codon:yes gene_type:complete
MEKIELDDFLSQGILKEKDFRQKIDEIDWEIYKNKKVLIKGCTSSPVPIWSYLIITARLTGVAKGIYFGEPCSSISIYKNNQ